MDEQYTKHKIFEELRYIIDFYNMLSNSSFLWLSAGTKQLLLTHDSYFFQSIEGSFSSIELLFREKRITDANVLVRKVYDDIITNIYFAVLLKENADVIKNPVVKDFDDWVKNTFRTPYVAKLLKHIETSIYSRELYRFFSWKTTLGNLRQMLDNNVHGNGFAYYMNNCSSLVLENRNSLLNETLKVIVQLITIHLSFLLVLNPHYLMASDYLECKEMGIDPPLNSEKWIAPFAQDAFNKYVKGNKELAEYVKGKSWLELVV